MKDNPGRELLKNGACELYQIPALRDNYIYVLRDARSGFTAVVDPSEAAPVLELLDAKGWALQAIYNTHHHFDHIGGNAELMARYRCPLYASLYDSARIPDVSHPLKGGDQLSCGAIKIEVLEVPGHTLGHIAFFLPEEALLFCGDTLFSLGCGRLFEGTAPMMWNSLEKFLRLPPETLVCCAHEYTLPNARFVKQIGHYPESFESYFREIEDKRERGLPTVPSRLGDEMLYNPFLKAGDARWAAALQQKADPGAALFARLRQQKDQSS